MLGESININNSSCNPIVLKKMIKPLKIFIFGSNLLTKGVRMDYAQNKKQFLFFFFNFFCFYFLKKEYRKTEFQTYLLNFYTSAFTLQSSLKNFLKFILRHKGKAPSNF